MQLSSVINVARLSLLIFAINVDKYGRTYQSKAKSGVSSRLVIEESITMVEFIDW